jgi:hypothetical protein
MTARSLSALARLVSLRRLRALLRATKSRPAGETAMTDPALVELLETPFETPAETHERLSSLKAALRDRGDRRAVFLTVYTRMTGQVRADLDAGRFENPEWLGDYVVTFADYYRRAFLAFERGDHEAVPEPWRIAFGRALAEDTLYVQDALLGINAHINYDLALALHDVGIESDRESKYADHRAINAVLAKLVDEQQRALADLYAPGVSDLDAVFGPIDESLSLLSMAEAREQAWRVAVVLTDFDFGAVESYARWVLRMTAVGGAMFVLSPSVDEDLLASLRRVEQREFDLADAIGLLETRLDALEHS